MRYTIRIHGNFRTLWEQTDAFDDATVATTEAIATARELMAQLVAQSRTLIADWSIEITDEGGELASLVPMHVILGAASSPQRYRSLYLATPHPYLLLSPRLTILEANRAYQHATMTDPHSLNGRHLFEAFPDNPNDPGANGVFNLWQSLERVMATGRADEMAHQRYDIRARNGDWCERYWKPVNFPVLDEDGEVSFIVHSVEDVTKRVAAKG
ncbi:MAG TPA: PAS domain-containing protein [Caulobacterales bacterium]|nr:PAS domain-containing protein [Caulobacterales bacterium]